MSAYLGVERGYYRSASRPSVERLQSFFHPEHLRASFFTERRRLGARVRRGDPTRRRRLPPPISPPPDFAASAATPPLPPPPRYRAPRPLDRARDRDSPPVDRRRQSTVPRPSPYAHGSKWRSSASSKARMGTARVVRDRGRANHLLLVRANHRASSARIIFSSSAPFDSLRLEIDVVGGVAAYRLFPLELRVQRAPYAPTRRARRRSDRSVSAAASRLARSPTPRLRTREDDDEKTPLSPEDPLLSPSSPRPARTRLRDSERVEGSGGFGSFGDASFGGEKLRAKRKHRRGVHADDGLGATRDDGALRAPSEGVVRRRDDAIGRRRDRDRTVASELGRDADADAAERVVVLVGARAGIVAVAASSSRSVTIRRRRAPRASASVVVVVAVLAAVPETAPRGSTVGVVELAAVPEGSSSRGGERSARGGDALSSRRLPWAPTRGGERDLLPRLPLLPLPLPLLLLLLLHLPRDRSRLGLELRLQLRPRRRARRGGESSSIPAPRVVV